MAYLSGGESRSWTVGELVERFKNLGVCATRASVTAALAELGLELEPSSSRAVAPARTRDRMDPGAQIRALRSTKFIRRRWRSMIPFGIIKSAPNCARSLSTSSGLPRIITKGVKPVGTMSHPSPARNHSRRGFSDTLNDSSTRQVGKSFTGSQTLTGSGWRCAQTALSLLIVARSCASKRARLIAVSGRQRWKLALALSFPPSTNRGGKNKGTKRGFGLGASILHGFGRNTSTARTAQNTTPGQAGWPGSQQSPTNRGVKAAARAKRAVIKMTLKGAGRRIAYAAVQSELRQGIVTVNVRIREERRALTIDTRQLSWVDWLQQQDNLARFLRRSAGSLEFPASPVC
jgi:hypothetical protein